MAENLGELIVSVSADITKLQEGLVTAGVLTEETAAKTEASTALISGLWIAAGAAVVVAIGAMIKTTIDYGEQILKASEKTGIATETLSQLKYAAEQSDVAFDSVVNGLKFLERSMFNAEQGNAKLAIAFQELGVNLKNAQGQTKSVDDVMLEAADRFKDMADETEKTALAMAIFGRAGTDMIPLLDQGSEGIKKLEKTANDLGVTLTKENAESLHKFEDNIKNTKTAFGGLSLEVTNDIIPALDGFINKITKGISLTRQFIQDVKSGELGKMLSQEAGFGNQPFEGKETDFGRSEDARLGFTPLPTVDPNQAKIKAVEDLATAEKAAQTARKQQAQEAIALTQRQDEQFKEYASSVVKLGGSIQAGFTTALSALILHGGTAKEIFQALGQTLVQSLVDFVAEQLIAHTIGQFIKTAESAAITLFGATTAAALAPAAAFMEIITLGGATGPATAGLSSVVLAAHGLTGFAEGTDTIPAMVSPGEMIIPQTFADSIRRGDLSIGGQGGNINQGGDTVNVNINAVITHPVDVDAVAKEIAFKTNRELRYLRPR